VFVLLFGVWWCYKRGKEERLKGDDGKEVLVEGTSAQDEIDHGIGSSIRPKETRLG
jgi:hypothetical protein